MSEHQELLKVLLDADEAHKAEGAMWPELADAILSAGYRKPRQVTTVEELDALPDEAAVLTRHGAVYIHSGKCWQGIGAGRFYSVWFEKSDSLPATVLHVGGTND